MGLSDATLSRVEQFSTNGFAWNKPSSNSQKSYRNHIKQLEEHLHTRGKTACEATTEDVGEYVAHIQHSLSPNTVATRIGVMKSYFGWLKREGKITHVPELKSLRHAQVQRVDVTEEDVQELLKQMPPTRLRYVRDAAMVTLMAYKGFSTQEVVDMNVNDVNFQDNLIRHRGKWQPMGKTSEHVLRYAQSKWDLGLEQKEDDPFFLNKTRQRISSRSLRRHFGFYLASANLKGRFSTRDLCISKSKKEQRVPQLVTG